MRPLFKGGNYSKEESINYLKLLTAETIQRRKVFKEENIRGNTVFTLIVRKSLKVLG